MEEFNELINDCNWQWELRSGIDGYVVTGPSENCIFLPAAGYRYGEVEHLRGGCGSYWSGVLSLGNKKEACYLHFGNGSRKLRWNSDRYSGRSIRPVSD